MPESPRISVIVPVYNGAKTLPLALHALLQSRPPPDEIIVVDDRSTDDSARTAREFPVTLIELKENKGAAAAKNSGAAAASGQVLLFVDSDVIVPCDVVLRLNADLADSDCVGVVGLLDENIPARNFASQFKNLWMNFTYSRFDDRGLIGLFYTSIAAMRRDGFRQLGGFEENYRGASIAEDTEFGQRAWTRGLNIRLDSQLRAVHLKGYSLSGLLLEDLRRARALTLMRIRKWRQPFFTSVPLFFQIALPMLYLTILLLVLSAGEPRVLVPATASLVAVYLLNIPLLEFLARKRGMLFAFESALFLPLDLFVVGLGMLAAGYDFARGRRY